MEIPNIRLFYSQKTKNYYYITPEDIFCYNCKNQITENFILHHSWGKRYYEHKYCLFCRKKIRKFGIREVDKLCIYSKKFNNKLIPVFTIPPPVMNSSEQDVFKMAEQKTEAEIIDNAVMSKAQHRINKQNFKPIDLKKYEYLDKPVEDVGIFIEKIKESKLLNFEGKEVLELEDGSNK